MRVPPTFTSDTCPLCLGSPLKVPSYAWSNWGIEWSDDAEYAELLRMANVEYRREWDSSTEQRHREIATASEEAGLGDANQRLNQACRLILAKEVARGRGRLNILDAGAGSGNTTLSILSALRTPSLPRFVLIDPSELALQSAASRLREAGLTLGEDFSTLVGTATETSPSLAVESFDVIVAVAAIHHHPDLVPPLRSLVRLLKPGGLVVFSDWHSSAWEHPSRVLTILEALNWPAKDDDLARFASLYPKAIEPAPERDGNMQRANSLIGEYWQSYARRRITSEPQSCVLDGQRPPARYLDAMTSVGLNCDRITGGLPVPVNPMTLPPEHGLLAVTVGRKEK